MSAKKYHVALTPEQRQRAEIVARSYKHSARERTRACVLLLADTNQPEGGATDEAICQQAGVCSVTVSQIRQRFAENGLDAALYRAEQKNRKPRVTGRQRGSIPCRNRLRRPARRVQALGTNPFAKSPD